MLKFYFNASPAEGLSLPAIFLGNFNAEDRFMMSEEQRKQAIASPRSGTPHKKKPCVQLSTTFPSIENRRFLTRFLPPPMAELKVEGGSRLIGHKIGLTSKAMAGILANRRAGLRPFVRRHVDTGRGQGISRGFLRAPGGGPKLTFILKQTVEGDPMSA